MKQQGNLWCLCMLMLMYSSYDVVHAANIVGYWGASPGGHASTLDQLNQAVSRGYTVIIYAFFDVDANGNLVQDPGSATPPSKNQINNSGSVRYLASLFGGQNGQAPTLTMSPDSWANAMYENFQQLHNTIGFDGIDIDLENAWGGTPNQVICGLRSFFHLMHSNGFVVSMAPQTTALDPEVGVYQPGSWNSYVPLIDTTIIQYVDILAVQLYNNAVPYNDIDSYASSLQKGFTITGCPSGCTIATSCDVIVPNNITTFGYPAGPGAAPSGCPSLPGGCPYGTALTTLYDGSAELKNTGGVMTWSIEWDEANSWEFISAASQISWD
eukprot:TRINITY_DN943_c0_g1_i1.p1 TRINITY_DN943_c0_g1~~TRINITY_DN943_c0_g1_i1.p1  ORF type:complete len:337 (-),score=82.09 TRINITY_DN943_c0_g1_i1:91-1068(-)